MSQTLRQGIISRADLLEVWVEFGDLISPETLMALGFEPPRPELTLPVDKMLSDGDDPPQGGDAAADFRGQHAAVKDLQFWRVVGYRNRLTENASDHDSHEPATQNPAEIIAAARQASAGGLQRLPLTTRSRLLTQVRQKKLNLRSSSNVDVDRVLQNLSRGEWLSAIPGKKVKAWGQGLLLMLDRSHRLVPYWDDQWDAVRALRSCFPPGEVRGVCLSDGDSVPRWMGASMRGGEPWELPPSGTLVIALTDLGTLEERLRGQQTGVGGSLQLWLRLGTQLRQAGHRPLAIVPCLPSAVPRALKRVWTVIPWDSAVCGAAAGEHELQTLATLLAPAIALEPRLIRAIRLLVPELRRDPGLESRLMQHPLVSSIHCVLSAVSVEQRKTLLEAFAEQPAELRRRVLRQILQCHEDSYLGISAEEILSLDEGSQSLIDPQLRQRAEDFFCALAEHSDPEKLDGLSSWLGRVCGRFRDLTPMKAHVRNALTRLAERAAVFSAGQLPGWMSKDLRPASQVERAVCVIEWGGQLEFVDAALEAFERPAGGELSVQGCALRIMANTQREARVFAGAGNWEARGGKPVELTAASLFPGGILPAWVHRSGVDEYEAWCSFAIKGIEQRLRWIPAGEFLMGSSTEDKESNDNERPVHLVRISRGFWLFDSPCTQGLWQALMGKKWSVFRGADLPVDGVSWEDVQAFVLALNTALPGLDARLPTESEWEYACRGPGAEQVLSRYGELDAIAWYGTNSGGRAHAVKQKLPNGYGLYDMLGSVWEWCADWCGPYSEATVVDPRGPSEGSFRVIRGGGWSDSARSARAACRYWNLPGVRYGYLGFRLLSQPVVGEEQEGAWSVSGGEALRGGSPQARSREMTTLGESEVQAVVWSDGQEGRVAIPRTSSFRIQTDCEEVWLQSLTRPEWANAIGRDGFGLWADFVVGGVRQRLRWIMPGRFRMGSPPGEPERGNDEIIRMVTITQGFWMFDTPCTQALWNAVVEHNKSHFQDPQRPVETVTWDEAREFAAQLSARLAGGLRLDLPTEAQWEYACRAGTTTPIYSGELEILGDADAPALDEIAWYGGNSGKDFDHADGVSARQLTWLKPRQYEFEKCGTRRVGLKRPNGWGLYDMLGNVWEWCADWHGPYSEATVVDPRGPSEGSDRVIRGGGWDGSARYARAACRNWSHPGFRYEGLGFRLLSCSQTGSGE